MASVLRVPWGRLFKSTAITQRGYIYGQRLLIADKLIGGIRSPNVGSITGIKTHGFVRKFGSYSGYQFQAKTDENNGDKNANNDGSKKKSGLKELMKKYGYAALGVYAALCVIDLPLCYLFVASVGDEKINEYKEKIKAFFGYGKKNDEEDAEGEKKEEEPSKYGSFLTTFFIAYGLHKSLIIIRLPLTATFTPKIVHTLQRYGFNIGKTSTKSVYKVTKQRIQDQGIKHSIGSKDAIKQSIKLANEQNGKLANNTMKALDFNYSKLDTSKFGSTPSKQKKWWNFFL